MTRKSASADAARINEAAAWFTRLCDDGATADDLAQWLEWCRDPGNTDEFERIEKLWGSIDAILPAARRVLARSEARAGGPRKRLQARSWVSASYSRHWRMGVAAALGCAVMGSALWICWHSLEVPRALAIVSAGSNRAATLPDGSRVVLAPRTHVTVNFAEGVRSVALSGGEAYFRVAHDKSKPFIVRVQRSTVTAVGTAFDIEADGPRIKVVVQEGIVRVLPVGEPAASQERWEVPAGNQLTYEDGKPGAQIAAIEVDREFSWIDGRLEYVRTPIRTVLKDINRYSGLVVELGDKDIGGYTFTGTVFPEAVADWLSALESTFKVRAIRAADNKVILVHGTDTVKASKK